MTSILKAVEPYFQTGKEVVVSGFSKAQGALSHGASKVQAFAIKYPMVFVPVTALASNELIYRGVKKILDVAAADKLENRNKVIIAHAISWASVSAITVAALPAIGIIPTAGVIATVVVALGIFNSLTAAYRTMEPKTNEEENLNDESAIRANLEGAVANLQEEVAEINKKLKDIYEQMSSENGKEGKEEPADGKKGVVGTNEEKPVVV